MTKQNDAAFSAEHRQYIARLNRSRRGIKLARWLILIVFIALWELFARVGDNRSVYRQLPGKGGGNDSAAVCRRGTVFAHRRNAL